MIKIKVPATTANLGPGFDTLGLALSLYNYFTFEKQEHYELNGFLSCYDGKDNLVLKAYQKVFSFLQVEEIPCKISIEQHIPLCGGLGSSATCIVGGVLGAHVMSGFKLTQEQIIELCVTLEGHPDNVLPCLLGGLVSSLKEKEKISYFTFPVHPSLCFTILEPPFSIETKEARKVLPKTYTLEEVIYTIEHLFPLSKALEEGNLEVLSTLMKDVLHEPYRLPLIKQGKEIQTWCREHHLPCVISGSGASMLVLSNSFNELKELPISWEKYELTIDHQGATVL